VIEPLVPVTITVYVPIGVEDVVDIVTVGEEIAPSSSMATD
jgi:hypothetical protein